MYSKLKATVLVLSKFLATILNNNAIFILLSVSTPWHNYVAKYFTVINKLEIKIE